MKRFLGYYRDTHGAESVVFELAAATYAVRVRGVRFSSSMLEDLEPDENTPSEQQASFALVANTLKHCEYGFSVPLTLVHEGKSDDVTLGIALQHAASSSLIVTLTTARGELVARSSDTYFDALLERLVAQLPQGAVLKFCFACRWGVIEPAYGLNGNFGCFRTLKQACDAAPTRQARMHLWPPPEVRQEIEVCEEFTPR